MASLVESLEKENLVKTVDSHQIEQYILNYVINDTSSQKILDKSVLSSTTLLTSDAQGSNLNRSYYTEEESVENSDIRRFFEWSESPSEREESNTEKSASKVAKSLDITPVLPNTISKQTLSSGTVFTELSRFGHLHYDSSNFTLNWISSNMYQPDQNRQDCSQGMHLHVHQCVCTSPIYGAYRQTPLLAPYVPSAVARPYNLAHYQYTQYNMPYNIPLFNTSAIAHQIPTTTVQLSDPAAVCRPERRIETPVEPTAVRTNDEIDLDFSNTDSSTECFTKFLEHGCVLAEKIAIRNQHRPCFKNIQNLCNRTKSEILKPSHTVSNIHSQGIPWATKDFIYAYVRLINCWHMLKGYLDAKDGTLGNIDRELTAEFKSCYTVWESNTKDLAEHMIRIFSNLDNNVSNPTPNRQRPTQTVVSPSANTDLSFNMDQTVNKTQQTEELNTLSESTTDREVSPREEESDGASRIYMKPGSYNVPKKCSSETTGQSIEFFETAKNVALHYKKVDTKKVHDNNNNGDKDWKNAISATSSFLKKNTNLEETTRSDLDENVDNAQVDVENVRRWLYHDHFDQQNLAYPLSDIGLLLPDRPPNNRSPADRTSKQQQQTAARQSTDSIQTLPMSVVNAALNDCQLQQPDRSWTGNINIASQHLSTLGNTNASTTISSGKNTKAVTNSGTGNIVTLWSNVANSSWTTGARSCIPTSVLDSINAPQQPSSHSDQLQMASRQILSGVNLMRGRCVTNATLGVEKVSPSGENESLQ